MLWAAAVERQAPTPEDSRHGSVHMHVRSLLDLVVLRSLEGL